MKHNPAVEIRNTTREDILEFFGTDSLPFTIRSLSFFVDGKLSALGGLRYERGYFIAFSEIKPDVTVSKATVYRCGLEVMKFIRKLGVPFIALADQDLESAPRFLERLGFQYIKTDLNGEVYQWQ